MKHLLEVCVVLIMVACSPDAFTYCEVPRIGTVASRADIDCSVVRHNFTEAERVLTKWLVPKADFAPVYSRVYFQIESTEVFNVGAISYSGYIDPFTGNISVNRSMKALAHEMLHAWDRRNGTDPLVTDPHNGWDAIGYNAVIDDYLTTWRQVSPSGST